MTHKNSLAVKPRFRFGCLHFLGIIGIFVAFIGLVIGWWIKENIYASQFEPTQLSLSERQVLDAKLSRLEQSRTAEKLPSEKKPEKFSVPLEPEPYSENDAQREIMLTERELNALVAKDPESARHVAIDLEENLVSVKLLIPVDKNFPILGGQTLKVNVGISLGYEAGNPVVVIRGVSLGGIPLPGAWWGDIKNKNLVDEFGTEGGFWDQFSKGVADLKVRKGNLCIKLRE